MSENWYFEFKIGDNRYRGSTHKSSKQEALEVERSYKNNLREINGSQDSKAKIDNLIRFREKVTNEIQGKSIKLEDIWVHFKQEAPAKLRKIPSEKVLKEKEAYLNDFIAFLKSRYPDCLTMRDVTQQMAEEYIGLIKTSGRFCKTIQSKGATYKNKNSKLSSSTIRAYITELKQIFRTLASTAGIMEDPFAQIKKPQKKDKKRDVFEVYELEKIDSYLNRLKNSHTSLNKRELHSFLINEAIFIIGINTGLRKGDISFLKWTDVNFRIKAISLETSKNEEKVFIPMTRNLYDFLKRKQQNQVNEYVTPELAEMYTDNEEGITYRFKQMLQYLEINSLKLHKGRSRRTSTKDIHSLRHTFCFLHGIQGTPLVVLQSMVGHMDKKMTEAYMMHQNEELKREAIEKFSLQPFQPLSLKPLTDRKKLIIDMVSKCGSDKLLENILAMLHEEKKNQKRGGNHQSS